MSEQPREAPWPGSSYTPGPAERQVLQTQLHLPACARQQSLTSLGPAKGQELLSFPLKSTFQEKHDVSPTTATMPAAPHVSLCRWFISKCKKHTPPLFQLHLVCHITSLICLGSSKFQCSALCSQLLPSTLSPENKWILHPMIPVNKSCSRSSTSYLLPILIIRLSKLIFHSLLMRMPEKAVQLWR